MKMTVRQMADHAAVRGLQQQGQYIIDLEREGSELSMQFMTRARPDDVCQMGDEYQTADAENQIYAGTEDCPHPCNYRAQSMRLDLGCPKIAEEIEQTLRPQMS